jgi:hypothetical protein
VLTALGGAGSSSGITSSNTGANSGSASAPFGGAGATSIGGSNANSGGSNANTASTGAAAGSSSNAQGQSNTNASPRPQGAVLVMPAVNTVPVPTAAAAAAFANSSWDVLMQELGAGQVLPEWLLKDPTPLLKSLMDCPSSYAVSVDGKCCGGEQ